MAESSDISLGDLKYAGANGEPVEVLKSDDSGEKVAQSVRFIVSDTAAADSKPHSTFVCWVDPEGKLHHHYTYDGLVMEHDENTFTGDAFVVYRILTADAPKPQNASDLGDDEAYAVLCSYRPRKALNQSKYTHSVQYSTAGCRVVSAYKGDDEYRVIARLPTDFGPHRLPPPDESWEVRYEYVCPPIPNSSTWNKATHTFYVWGDMDFDDYGLSHRNDVPDHCRRVHPCSMNQIVPQLMIGNCLSSNDDDYTPSWKSFDSWVIQAQYFWRDGDGNDRAMCGEIIEAKPGDVILTKIRYDCEPGSISASVAIVKEDDVDKKEDPKKRSKIVIQRPFPHDPSLFKSWKDFFRRCVDAENGAEAKSMLQRLFGCCAGRSHRPSLRGGSSEAVKGPLGRPCLNVEYKGRVDMETLKSVCPFIVHEASFPGLTPGSTSRWRPELFCPRTGRVDTLKDADESNSLHVQDAMSLFQG